MSATLRAWNAAACTDAMEAMLACCGARRWAEAMIARRPIADMGALSSLADETWSTMQEADWLEAFACHPRIGARVPAHAGKQATAWSREEQAGAGSAEENVLERLSEANVLYEERFGFTYIVCATGKSADEMLAILERRLNNPRVVELREAAEQQRLILQIRLIKGFAA